MIKKYVLLLLGFAALSINADVQENIPRKKHFLKELNQDFEGVLEKVKSALLEQETTGAPSNVHHPTPDYRKLAIDTLENLSGVLDLTMAKFQEGKHASYSAMKINKASSAPEATPGYTTDEHETTQAPSNATHPTPDYKKQMKMDALESVIGLLESKWDFKPVLSAAVIEKASSEHEKQSGYTTHEHETTQAPSSVHHPTTDYKKHPKMDALENVIGLLKWDFKPAALTVERIEKASSAHERTSGYTTHEHETTQAPSNDHPTPDYRKHLIKNTIDNFIRLLELKLVFRHVSSAMKINKTFDHETTEALSNVKNQIYSYGNRLIINTLENLIEVLEMDHAWYQEQNLKNVPSSTERIHKRSGSHRTNPGYATDKHKTNQAPYNVHRPSTADLNRTIYDVENGLIMDLESKIAKKQEEISKYQEEIAKYPEERLKYIPSCMAAINMTSSAHQTTSVYTTGEHKAPSNAHHPTSDAEEIEKRFRILTAELINKTLRLGVMEFVEITHLKDCLEQASTMGIDKMSGAHRTTPGYTTDDPKTTGSTKSEYPTTTHYVEKKSTTGSPTLGYVTEIPSSTAVPEVHSTGGYPMRVGSIIGVPGVNFPNYTDIPITSFTCSDKEFFPGFYADLDSGCQVFHVCWSNRRESFLCPLGTTFNQALLACDYWYSTNCSRAPHYYSANSEISHSGGSKLKDETIISMANDLLLKGQVHSSFAQTEDKGSKVPTVPDAIALISQFLPIKAKVVVYPETSEKRAKIVASTSIGQESVQGSHKEASREKMKFLKQRPTTDESTLDPHSSMKPTLAPELSQNTRKRQEEEMKAAMLAEFYDRMITTLKAFQIELQKINSQQISSTTTTPYPHTSETPRLVTEETRKCKQDVTTPDSVTGKPRKCKLDATTPASVTEQPPKRVHSVTPASVTTQPPKRVHSVTPASVTVGPPKGTHSIKRVPKIAIGKKPQVLPRVDPRFVVPPAVIPKALPKKSISKAPKSASPSKGKLSMETKKALMQNFLRLLKAKGF